jgi:hypothetical protein
MTYLDNIKVLDIDLITYLNNSIESETDKAKLCLGWDYLKANITEELKQIILNSKYWELKYNAEKENYILNQLFPTDEINKIPENLIKQLGSFVYNYNCLKREFEKVQEEYNLKVKLESEGFKEQDILNLDELKKLDGLKIFCVFDRDKIGLMGSFTIKEQYEGKFYYDFHRDYLFFIPKGHSKTGQLLRTNFYYKLKGGIK